MNRLKNSAVKTVSGVIFLIVIVETLARTVWRDEMTSLFSQGFDPEIGFVKKGDEIIIKRLPARNIWPQSIPAKKNEGVARVFVVGSSVSRGTEESNYPFIIRDSYSTKVLPTSGRRLELYNLSATGYGIRRKMALLDQALSLRPDLIMVHLDGSNEFEDERERNTAHQYDGYANPTEWPMKLWVFRFVAQRRTEKLVWRYIPREARKNTISNDADIELARSNTETTQKVWRDRLEKNIGIMVQKATNAGVPLVFIVRGVYDKNQSLIKGRVIPNNFEDDLSHFLIHAVTPYKRSDVLVVRLGTVFSDLMLKPSDYTNIFADSTHLKEAGHRAVANYLYSKILSIL